MLRKEIPQSSEFQREFIDQNGSTSQWASSVKSLVFSHVYVKQLTKQRKKMRQ